MKESEKIAEKCKNITQALNKCLQESGYRGRYLFYCRNFEKQYAKCKIQLHEQKRKEHNIETRKKHELYKQNLGQKA